MYHRPVLLKEVLSFWHSKKGGFYIDATVGTGGHAEALLEQDDQAVCLALDCDPEAVRLARERLGRFGKRALLLKENYIHLPEIMRELGTPKASGLLLDLGVSSLQLDVSERGFSFLKKGPLDMRMDSEKGENAKSLIHRLSIEELAKLIKRFGEEPKSKPIAIALKKAESNLRLTDTLECAQIISRTLLGFGKPFSRKKGEWRRFKELHPATKTFQALRIAVNRELENLEGLLKKVSALLVFGGRAVFISFHSLEDRLVKNAMKMWCAGCVCPSDFPKCVCGKNPEFKILTPKVLRASQEEVEENPRSRSARMRSAEKI